MDHVAHRLAAAVRANARARCLVEAQRRPAFGEFYLVMPRVRFRMSDDDLLTGVGKVAIALGDSAFSDFSHRSACTTGQNQLLVRIQGKPDLVGVQEAEALEGVLPSMRLPQNERGIRGQEVSIAGDFKPSVSAAEILHVFCDWIQCGGDGIVLGGGTVHVEHPVKPAPSAFKLGGAWSEAEMRTLQVFRYQIAIQ